MQPRKYHYSQHNQLYIFWGEDANSVVVELAQVFVNMPLVLCFAVGYVVASAWNNIRSMPSRAAESVLAFKESMEEQVDRIKNRGANIGNRQEGAGVDIELQEL